MNTKLQNQSPTATQSTTQRAKPKARRLTELPAPSELPQFIKGEELAKLHPFTIFGAIRLPGRYGDKFHFDVAYKNSEGTVIKRVLTLSVDRTRETMAREIISGGPFINCRIIKINTSPTTSYWKIIDIDDPIPEEISAEFVSDNEIPF